MDDLISRQEAIDAICMEWCNVKHQDCKHPFDAEKCDYYWCDGCETALRTLPGLPSAQPEQKWIPCSERLPEANTRCLCTYENEEGTCIDFGLYMKRGWFVSGVTAWMPLPEPYKEDADDPEG